MKDTSLLTAACRAKFCETYSKGEKNFGDFYAVEIVGDKINMFDDIIYNKFPPGTVDVFGFRSQFTDDYIIERNLPEQIVILGAGMDTLGARFSEIFRSENTRIYEIDLPATQEVKRQLVQNIVGYDDSMITYVGCDFNNESFTDRLSAEGFEANKKTTFIWMGVSYYLPETTVTDILEKVLILNRENEILFDYAVDLRHKDESIEKSEQALKEMKEPIMCKYADITPLLSTIGYKAVKEISLFAYALENGGPVYPNDKRYLRFVRASGKSK